MAAYKKESSLTRALHFIIGIFLLGGGKANLEGGDPGLALTLFAIGGLVVLFAFVPSSQN